MKDRKKKRGREEERICVNFTLGGHIASMQYFLLHVSYQMHCMTSGLPLPYTAITLKPNLCVELFSNSD